MGIEYKNTKKMFNLPSEIKFCTKCVMSNQRPRITFDEDGVCNACRYWEAKENGTIDWNERERLLKDTLDRYRKNDGFFIQFRIKNLQIAGRE